WSLVVDDYDVVERLWANGDERYIYRENKTQIGVSYGIAHRNVLEVTRRFTFGYHYEDSAFIQADEEDYEDLDLDPEKVSNDLADLPFDRRFSGPVFGFQKIVPNFISMNYIDRFDRVED